MKTWRLQLALLCALAIICGCKPSADTSAASKADTPPRPRETGPRIVTEQELARFIVVGMHKTALITNLGEAELTERLEDGRIRLDYIFAVPQTPGPRRSVVSGVTVYLKDDHVVRWAPAYASTGGYREGYQPEVIQPPKDATRQTNQTNALTFWVVSETPVDGGRYIDTPLFPKLGFVRNQPDLRVNRLKTLLQERELLLNDKGEEIENRFLNVHFVDEDAAALTKITSENQGKRVLIMVEDRPVAAPKILGTIASAFQLHCKDDQTLKEAREKLAYLLLK